MSASSVDSEISYMLNCIWYQFKR